MRCDPQSSSTSLTPRRGRQLRELDASGQYSSRLCVLRVGAEVLGSAAPGMAEFAEQQARQSRQSDASSQRLSRGGQRTAAQMALSQGNGVRVPRQSFLDVRAKLLAEVAALEAPAHAKGLELPPVDCDAILPLVEKARWSSDLDVKRDAVAGIASLAANRENQEAIGRMGGLQAVAHIVLGDASGKALPRVAADAASAAGGDDEAARPKSSTRFCLAGPLRDSVSRWRASRATSEPVDSAARPWTSARARDYGRMLAYLERHGGRGQAGAAQQLAQTLRKWPGARHTRGAAAAAVQAVAEGTARSLPTLGGATGALAATAQSLQGGSHYALPRFAFTLSRSFSPPRVRRARFTRPTADAQLLRLAAGGLANLLRAPFNQRLFMSGTGVKQLCAVLRNEDHRNGFGPLPAPARYFLAMALRNLARNPSLRCRLYDEGAPTAMLALACGSASGPGGTAAALMRDGGGSSYAIQSARVAAETLAMLIDDLANAARWEVEWTRDMLGLLCSGDASVERAILQGLTLLADASQQQCSTLVAHGAAATIAGTVGNMRAHESVRLAAVRCLAKLKDGLLVRDRFRTASRLSSTSRHSPSPIAEVAVMSSSCKSPESSLTSPRLGDDAACGPSSPQLPFLQRSARSTSLSPPPRSPRSTKGRALRHTPLMESPVPSPRNELEALLCPLHAYILEKVESRSRDELVAALESALLFATDSRCLAAMVELNFLGPCAHILATRGAFSRRARELAVQLVALACADPALQASVGTDTRLGLLGKLVACMQSSEQAVAVYACDSLVALTSAGVVQEQLERVAPQLVDVVARWVDVNHASSLTLKGLELVVVLLETVRAQVQDSVRTHIKAFMDMIPCVTDGMQLVMVKLIKLFCEGTTKRSDGDAMRSAAVSAGILWRLTRIAQRDATRSQSSTSIEVRQMAQSVLTQNFADHLAALRIQMAFRRWLARRRARARGDAAIADALGQHAISEMTSPVLIRGRTSP